MPFVERRWRVGSCGGRRADVSAALKEREREREGGRRERVPALKICPAAASFPTAAAINVATSSACATTLS
jgi:hypothetical protein